MEIYAMRRRWIVLMTVVQVILTTLATTSVDPAETNNYRQVKARVRALDHHSGQLQVQAQVSTDRTFTGTRQPKPQKNVDYRRPSSTVNTSVQRRQQQQPQQPQQQQYDDSAMSYLDWTPIVQPKTPLQRDYQQRQVSQPDAIVTFVTPPAPITTTTRYNGELRPKNHVQHFDNESDDFRNGYVNASELSEENNNKHHNNITRITNTYGDVEKHRKNSNFGFHDGVLEKNKTRRRQNNYSSETNATKEQNKHPSQVYNLNFDENHNERLPQSYDSHIEHNPRQNTHHLVNTDVLQLQLADKNNKHNGQIANVKSKDQEYRKSQHFHLLDGESKSDLLRNYPNNTTADADLQMKIEHKNSHTEVYDNMYDTDVVDVANEQRLINYNQDVDGGNRDFYRDDNYYLQYVNSNGIVDGGNNTHRDAYVDTYLKATKHENGRKYVSSMFDQDTSKNKQRVNSNQYLNMNVTTAEGLVSDSVVVYKLQGHIDEREEIEHQHRRKPSVTAGAKVNPTIPTTVSTRQLQRKVQSSAQTRRPPANENNDKAVSQTFYDGQNSNERKYKRNDRGHYTTPSNKQPSMMTTLRAHVIEDVIDGDDNDSVTEEELEQAEQGGYGFGYTVFDENVGMDFGQWERREPGRTGTVTGLYRVRLPDGRIQTVEYTAGPATGYRASVTYEGVQRHPAAAPPPLVERYDSTGSETRSPA